MERAELEQIIEQARLDRSTSLNLSCNQLTFIPDSIGTLTNLTWLKLGGNKSDKDEFGFRTDASDWALFNKIEVLPKSIGNLTNLTSLDLGSNQLITIPESICQLTELTFLNLSNNQLIKIPENIGNLSSLTYAIFSGNQLSNIPESIDKLLCLISLNLSCNQLSSLPDNIGNLSKIEILSLDDNQLNSLPESIGNLCNLEWLNLEKNQISFLPENFAKLCKLNQLNLGDNPLKDLSILQSLRNLKIVFFLGVRLPYRYWKKLCEWKSEWLLDEDNVEVRRILVAQIGYERICNELNAISLDTWREYTLLKIDGVEKIYARNGKIIATEPMLLLKMNCPSTAHIHILRVPPEMVSAEAAITWINHGIHPDDFVIQT
jgi:leucine-rich repeat protein SHOC2